MVATYRNWTIGGVAPQPPDVANRPPITSSVINVIAKPLARPPIRTWVTDDSFGYDMELMRVSGPDDGQGVRNDYSKGYSTFWSWSKDQTYFRQLNGRLLNGTTFEFIKNLSLPSSGRAHFSNLDDNKMFVLGDNKIAVLNIATNVRTTMYDFTAANGWDRSGADGIVSTDSEGTIDENDKYIVVKMLRSGVECYVLFDLQLGQIVTYRTRAQLGGGEIDSVKISKSGNFIMVNETGVGKLMHYTSNWANATGTNYISNCSTRSHMDFAFDTAGREVLTSMSYTGYVDILTGVFTEFVPNVSEIQVAFGGAGNTGGHSSGQCPKGEGVFSFHTLSADNPYIISAELHPTGRKIRRWIHSRRGDSTGNSETAATMSRDGTMICFTSNFNDGGDDVTCIVRRKIA